MTRLSSTSMVNCNGSNNHAQFLPDRATVFRCPQPIHTLENVLHIRVDLEDLHGQRRLQVLETSLLARLRRGCRRCMGRLGEPCFDVLKAHLLKQALAMVMAFVLAEVNVERSYG